MPQTEQHKILMRLSLLLQLQRRARQAKPAELPFIFVNETHALVPYRQAVLWQIRRDGSWKVIAVSGLATPDPGAPFVLWLESLSKSIVSKQQHALVHSINREELPKNISESWQEWLPAFGFWFPLFDRQEQGKEHSVGAITFFREEPLLRNEQELLTHITETYGQCVPAINASKTTLLPARFSPSIKNWRIWLIVTIALLLLFPVRQTVLAPAEVTAIKPAHIRAGLDGVIKDFFISPNDPVIVGQKLFTLEDEQLRTQLVVAQKSLDIAKAELQQMQQLSLVDSRSKIRLPMLQGRVEQLVAEVQFVQTQLARVTIISPVNGIAVIDSPSAWLGRPVSLGQKVLEIANPAQVELEISLPMSETLPLEKGDTILFFPNISPHAPLSGSLTYIGYQATETPEAGIAFTLRASFTINDNTVNEKDLPRLGLRGSAKLYGTRMPLIAILLRRPFLQVRQWLGM